MKRNGIYESSTRWQNGHYQSAKRGGIPPRIAEDGNLRFKFHGDILNPATDTAWLLPYREIIFNKQLSDFDRFEYNFLTTSLFIEKELHRIDYNAGNELSLLVSPTGVYDRVETVETPHDVDYYLTFLYKFVFATNSAGQLASAYFTTNAGNYISAVGQYGTFTTTQAEPTDRLYFDSALKRAVDLTSEFRYTKPTYITAPDSTNYQIEFMGSPNGYQLNSRRWIKDNSFQTNVQRNAVHRSSVFCPMPIGRDIMNEVTSTIDYSCNYNLPGMIRAFVGNYVKDERTSSQYYERPLHVWNPDEGIQCRFYNMAWENVSENFLRGLMLPRLYKPVIMSNSYVYSGYSIMNGIVGMFVLTDRYGRIRYEGDVSE